MSLLHSSKPAVKLPRQDWKYVIRRTAFHTAFSVLASVAVCTVLLDTFSGGIDRFGMAAAILAPILLGGPMLFMMFYKQRQLERAYAELAATAARDSLTGCLNHGGFVSAVAALLQAGQGGTLLVIDADHFKAINDRFGHAVGDTALQSIAGAIRDHAGEQAIVGRLGGEEFGVFAPETDIAIARLLGERIRAAVETLTLETAEPGYNLSVSIGGAVSRGDALFDALFRSADAALYRVKEGGRNAVSIAHSPSEIPEVLRATA